MHYLLPSRRLPHFTILKIIHKDFILGLNLVIKIFLTFKKVIVKEKMWTH